MVCQVKGQESYIYLKGPCKYDIHIAPASWIIPWQPGNLHGAGWPLWCMLGYHSKPLNPIEFPSPPVSMTREHNYQNVRWREGYRPCAAPGVVAAVCGARCCCPALSGELSAGSASAPSHRTAPSPVRPWAQRWGMLNATKQSAHALETIDMNKVTNGWRLNSCRLVVFFCSALPPGSMSVHLSVSRSDSCFCRVSTFPSSSDLMASSDWSLCVRCDSDLCSLEVHTK